MYNNNTNNTWVFLTKTKRMVLQRRKVRKYYWFIIITVRNTYSKNLVYYVANI